MTLNRIETNGSEYWIAQHEGKLVCGDKSSEEIQFEITEPEGVENGFRERIVALMMLQRAIDRNVASNALLQWAWKMNCIQTAYWLAHPQVRIGMYQTGQKVDHPWANFETNVFDNSSEPLGAIVPYQVLHNSPEYRIIARHMGWVIGYDTRRRSHVVLEKNGANEGSFRIIGLDIEQYQHLTYEYSTSAIWGEISDMLRFTRQFVEAGKFARFFGEE